MTRFRDKKKLGLCLPQGPLGHGFGTVSFRLWHTKFENNIGPDFHGTFPLLGTYEIGPGDIV